MLDFKRITLEDKPIFDEVLKDKKYLSCEFCFSNFYIWKDAISTEVAFADNSIFVRGILNNVKEFYFMPIAKNGYMDEALELLIKEVGDKLYIKCATDMILDEVSPQLLSKFIKTDDSDISDYVYNSENLITLKGKKYHRKRNHVNKFQTLYNYEFSPMSREDVDECLEFNERWLSSKDEITVEMKREHESIKNALRNYEDLGLIGGVIKIDGEIKAFSVGEVVHEDMGIVHFEKGDTNYEGIYQAINKFFAEYAFSNVKYINRQDDMGLPGLRKAKKSYYPVFMVKKYILELKG